MDFKTIKQAEQAIVLRLQERYLPEREDPLHRSIEILKSIHELFQSSNTTLSFSVWLRIYEAGKNEPVLGLHPLHEFNDYGLKDPAMRVEYFSQEELQISYRLFAKEGVPHVGTSSSTKKLLALAEEIFLSKKQKPCFLFILQAGELYSCIKLTNKYHHSSLSSGGSVESAGIIRLNSAGKIILLEDYSGHYLPNLPAFIQGVVAFYKLGLLDSNTKICINSWCDEEEQIRNYNDALLFLELYFPALREYLQSHGKADSDTAQYCFNESDNDFTYTCAGQTISLYAHYKQICNKAFTPEPPQVAAAFTPLCDSSLSRTTIEVTRAANSNGAAYRTVARTLF